MPFQYVFRVGDVGDCYRPVDQASKESLEFAFVGFYRIADVDFACDLMGGQEVDGVSVTVEAIKPWYLDLYPK